MKFFVHCCHIGISVWFLYVIHTKCWFVTKKTKKNDETLIFLFQVFHHSSMRREDFPTAVQPPWQRKQRLRQLR